MAPAGSHWKRTEDTSTSEQLVDAIRATAAGQTYVGLRVSRNINRLELISQGDVHCQLATDVEVK